MVHTNSRGTFPQAYSFAMKKHIYVKNAFNEAELTDLFCFTPVTSGL